MCVSIPNHLPLHLLSRSFRRHVLRRSTASHFPSKSTPRHHTSATLLASTLVKLNHDVRSHFSTTETFFGPQRFRNPYLADFFRYYKRPRVKLCYSTVSMASTVQFDSALPTSMTNKLGITNNNNMKKKKHGCGGESRLQNGNNVSSDERLYHSTRRQQLVGAQLTHPSPHPRSTPRKSRPFKIHQQTNSTPNLLTTMT